MGIMVVVTYALYIFDPHLDQYFPYYDDEGLESSVTYTSVI